MGTQLNERYWRLKPHGDKFRVIVVAEGGFVNETPVTVAGGNYPKAMFFSAYDHQLLQSLSDRLDGLLEEKHFDIPDRPAFVYGAIAAARFATPLHMDKLLPHFTLNPGEHDVGSFIHIKHTKSSTNSLFMVANTMSNAIHCVTLYNFGKSLAPPMSTVFLSIRK